VVNRPSVYRDSTAFRAANHLGGKPIIALLPGSRKQEIRRMLPEMVALSGSFRDYKFVIAGAPSIEPSFYQQITGKDGPAILFGQTHELLRHAHAAVVTSGTATLETALFGIPQVVCYRGGSLSYAIARRIVEVKFISLVNLVMDRQVVKELIQGDFNAENLEKELKVILEESNRSRIMAEYALLKDKLGGEGASGRAATAIFNFLCPKP